MCKNDLKKHISTHESNPHLSYSFTCEICGKKSIHKSDLQKHITHKSNAGLRCLGYLFLVVFLRKKNVHTTD